MTKQEMFDYISTAKEAFPKLSVVVFSGGECSILEDDLLEAIHYAHNLELSTRIVTNGHWAYSMPEAIDFVNKLVKAGLNEINFSTGFEHSQFVPVSILSNAIAACASSPNFSTILVSIEQSKSHILDINSIKNSTQLTSLPEKIQNKIVFIYSPWIEFRKQYGKDKKESPLICLSSQRGCTDVLSTISISPTGQFLSCCGFATEYSPFLKLGKVTKENFRRLHESRFDDLLKIWLYTSGPFHILKQVGEIPDSEKGERHACEYCLRILTNRNIIEKVANESLKRYNQILLDYTLKTHRYGKQD